MSLDNLRNGITNFIAKTKGFLGTPAGAAIGGGVIGAAVGGTIVGAVTKFKRKSKKSYHGKKRRTKKASARRGRSIKHTRRGWRQDQRRRSKQSWEVAYQKRKKKGGRRHKPRRLVKGSKEAKAYMAKLRRMRK